MAIEYFPDLIQNSDEWLNARCGMLTASNIKLILTPTLKIASNDKERAHLYELVAQRITKHVEPTYQTYDMERGHREEILARKLYHEQYAPLQSMGFITNDRWGFKIGCSPDALLLDNSKGIEAKSRKHRFQIETIMADEMPEEFKLQVQTCMLVKECDEWDFISYSGGLPMFVKTIKKDRDTQAAILDAAEKFEERAHKMVHEFAERIAEKAFFSTELTPEPQEIF